MLAKSSMGPANLMCRTMMKPHSFLLDNLCDRPPVFEFETRGISLSLTHGG